MENIDAALAGNWLGFDWSPWISLHPDNNEFQRMPTDHGVYRVRHEAYEGLIYIGQTGRGLRERLRALSGGIYDGEMPYSSPHTGSPSLCAIEDRYGPGFEPFTKSKAK